MVEVNQDSSISLDNQTKIEIQVENENFDVDCVQVNGTELVNGRIPPTEVLDC